MLYIECICLVERELRMVNCIEFDRPWYLSEEHLSNNTNFQWHT